MRSPGWPTVPAMNRSGRSKRCTCRAIGITAYARHGRTGQPAAPAPPPTAASPDAAPAPAAAARRQQPGHVAAGVVHPQHERPGVGVADHRHRARVDHDPLEEVEVQAERVGQQRLDHVAVAAGQPDRLRPGRRGHRASHSRTAATARAWVCGQPLPVRPGEHRRGRVLLHHLPQRLLGQLLQRPAGPVAVPHLGQPRLDLRPPASRPAASGRRGLHAPLQRAGHHRGQRHRRAAARPPRRPGRGRARRGARPACARPAPARSSRSARAGRAGRWPRRPLFQTAHRRGRGRSRV